MPEEELKMARELSEELQFKTKKLSRSQIEAIGILIRKMHVEISRLKNNDGVEV